MPYLYTVSRVVARRSSLNILVGAEYPARPLASYLLGPEHRIPVLPAIDNLNPSSETAPRFYTEVCVLHVQYQDLFSDTDVRN